MVEAVFVFRLARLEWTAGSDAKAFAHGLQRAAKGARIGKRAKVAGPVLLAHAGEAKARHGLGEVHAHEQKAFVVAKADVVFRAKFLNEAALEKHGLCVAADGVVFQIPDAVDKRACLEIG